MTTDDPDRDKPTADEGPTEAEPVPPFSETEHIKDDDEPLGANFA
jgi:hypothetical protein